jgi:hypothetical protein
MEFAFGWAKFRNANLLKARDVCTGKDQRRVRPPPPNLTAFHFASINCALEGPHYLRIRCWKESVYERHAMKTYRGMEKNSMHSPDVAVVITTASYSRGPAFKPHNGDQLSWLIALMVFFSHSKYMPVQYLKLGHDRLLADHFQFFPHWPSYRSTLFEHLNGSWVFSTAWTRRIQPTSTDHINFRSAVTRHSPGNGFATQLPCLRYLKSCGTHAKCPVRAASCGHWVKAPSSQAFVRGAPWLTTALPCDCGNSSRQRVPQQA